MTLYLDTSAIVALLVSEPTGEHLASWLHENSAGGSATSRWVSTEVASALSIKVRTGELTHERRTAAASEWQRMRTDNLTLLPIDDAAFETAAGFAGRPELGLRAGDALHLAIAAAHGCTLVTLDKQQAKAASTLGVHVAAL